MAENQRRHRVAYQRNEMASKRSEIMRNGGESGGGNGGIVASAALYGGINISSSAATLSPRISGIAVVLF